jgi:hypothetical protein
MHPGRGNPQALADPTHLHDIVTTGVGGRGVRMRLPLPARLALVGCDDVAQLHGSLYLLLVIAAAVLRSCKLV